MDFKSISLINKIFYSEDMEKKNNKNTRLFSVLFLFSFFLMSFSFVQAADPCDPTIKIINQDPNPAVPDDYVSVLFEVTNLANCNGLAVKLNPEYPFSFDSNSSAIQTISSIPFATGAKNSWMIPYKVRVDKDAFDGDYSLKLQYQPGTDTTFISSYTESKFNVTIKDSRIAFDAVIQESTSSGISIAIANIGKYAANSVVVRIPEQDSFTVSGTDGQMVGNLASGDYTLVGFTVSPKVGGQVNMSRGTYKTNSTQSFSSTQTPKLKFDIYYTDNIGVRRVSNMELPLRMSGNNSSTVGATGYARGSKISTPWYSSVTNWFILVVVIVILYFLSKKYPKKAEKFKSFFKKKSSKNISQQENNKVPEWIKNSKEKEKKK